MAKPLSVVRAAAQADALIRAQAPTAPDPAPTLALVQDPEPEAEEQFEASTETLEAGEPAFEPAPAPAPGEPVDYEHRFKVLQGKYNAETRQLREDARAAQVRLDQTTALLATLSERKAEPAQAPAPEPIAPSLTLAPLTKSELDEFGEDMLGASSRFTLAQVMPVIDALRADVAALRAQMSKTAATVSDTASTIALTARERMFAELDQNVPTWRTTNEDSGFLKWLAEDEGLSGENRHTLLKRAFDRNEAARVQRFFAAYLSESTSGDEHAKGRAAKPNPPSAPSVASPSALVAPGRGRAAPVISAPQALEWTADLIRSFYDDVRNGVFRNAPEERQRLEADIFAAQREGRIVD